MATSDYTSLEPFSFQTISATSSTAQSLTIASASAASASLSEPNFAFVVCETNSCRWRDDGTVPTATTGTLLPTSTGFSYDGTPRALSFISTAGTSTINVTLYRAA